MLQHGIVVVRKKQQPNELAQMYASDVTSKLEKIHIVSFMGYSGTHIWLMSNTLKDQPQSMAATISGCSCTSVARNFGSGRFGGSQSISVGRC